jgi:signal transduction histidine kinase
MPGDRDRLLQAVGLLIHFLVERSPSGGSIRVAADREGSAALVAVNAAKPELPPAILEKAFAQAAGGLALPLARQIARLHGGRAWGETAPGAGITLYLSLPLTR